MRAYEIQLKDNKDEITLELRLDYDALSAMKKKYNGEEPWQSVLSSVADIEKMAFIFNLALNYDGNTNKVKTGKELFNLLVDNGYGGQVSFAIFLKNIALFSGIIDERQANEFQRRIDGVSYEQEDNEEKNQETSDQ